MTLPPLALVIAVFVLSEARTLRSEIKDILDDVPQEDRTDFLRFYLNRAFLLTQDNTTAPEKQLTNQQSIQLYDYLLNNYKITDEATINAVENIVCFPNIGCIDLDDPGIFPK